MNNNITTDENPTSIVISIFLLYILIEGFFFYLHILHRINISSFIIFSVILLIFYIPRFKILNKLIHKDIVKINDTEIIINNKPIPISQIEDYRVEEKKTKVLFFFNNKMVVYNEAIFHLKYNNGIINFYTIGSQKIELLKEFLDMVSAEKKQNF